MNQKQKQQRKIKKSNKGFIALIIILIVLIIGSCVGVYFLARPDKDDNKKEEKVDMTSIIFTKETLPRVDGSLATQPLIDAFVKNFTGKTTEEIGIVYSNTHPGYVKLINGETDLIIVTEPSAEEQKLAQEKGVELEVTKVVNEGFVFFVNINNKVDGLKFEEIQKIYTG